MLVALQLGLPRAKDGSYASKWLLLIPDVRGSYCARSAVAGIHNSSIPHNLTSSVHVDKLSTDI